MKGLKNGINSPSVTVLNPQYIGCWPSCIIKKTKQNSKKFYSCDASQIEMSTKLLAKWRKLFVHLRRKMEVVLYW